MSTFDVLLHHFRKMLFYVRRYAVTYSYLLCTLGGSKPISSCSDVFVCMQPAYPQKHPRLEAAPAAYPILYFWPFITIDSNKVFIRFTKVLPLSSPMFTLHHHLPPVHLFQLLLSFSFTISLQSKCSLTLDPRYIALQHLTLTLCSSRDHD